MNEQRYGGLGESPDAPAVPCAFCAAAEQAGARLRVVERPAGAVLLRHGAPVLDLYCVRSGRVRLSVGDASGIDRAFAMRGPGSPLGLEVLLGLPARFDAVVDLTARLVVWEPKQLQQWALSHPEHGLLLLKQAVAEMTRLAAERQLIDGTAEARLARFLLERESDSLLAAWRGAHRHEVAGLLGMRPETLSRTARALQRRGLVDADLHVNDLDALRDLAGESNHSSDP